MNPIDKLTDRELEIIGLLLDGMSAKQAASELGVSPFTVRTHIGHIHEKTGTHSTVHAIGVISGWKPDRKSKDSAFDWLQSRFEGEQLAAMIRDFNGRPWALGKFAQKQYKPGDPDKVEFIENMRIVVSRLRKEQSSAVAANQNVTVNPR